MSEIRNLLTVSVSELRCRDIPSSTPNSMKTHSILRAAILSAVAVGSISGAFAQALPTSQPKLISIERESVKVGRAAEHARHEAGWPAALEKAKYPDYYIAITSMTGPREAWYVSSWENHAALGESMKRDIKDEALTKEMDALALKDAEYINDVRTVQAAAMPDISIGKFPDMAKVRFFQVMTMRVKPGAEMLFIEAAKAYGSAAKRANPDVSYRVYAVIAGMPAPTYLVFSTVENYSEFDAKQRDEQALWKGATADDLAVLQKFSTEGMISSEVNRYRLDPRQSYVPKETRDKDPEFWNGK